MFLTTTRLNARSRLLIVDAALEHRFLSELKSIIALNKELADEAFHRKWSHTERATMAGLPEGWLDDYKGIDVRDAGERHFLNFDGSFFVREETTSRFCHSHYGPAEHRRMPFNYDSLLLEGSLLTRVRTVLKLQHKFVMEFISTSAKLNVMVKSYNTIGALKEAWPEITPFVPKESASAKVPTKLPAVRTQELNMLLRLPA
jgi:putative DNA base modification enzyme with NMAD domain